MSVITKTLAIAIGKRIRCEKTITPRHRRCDTCGVRSKSSSYLLGRTHNSVFTIVTASCVTLSETKRYPTLSLDHATGPKSRAVHLDQHSAREVGCCARMMYSRIPTVYPGYAAGKL